MLRASAPRRLYPVIAVLGLLASCGGGSTGPSNNPPQHIEQIPLPAGPLVAFMGDSITQYWTGGAPAYPTIAITTLVPGAVDAGVAGETTDQMEQRFAADVLAKNPAIVVILGGTNDIRLQQSPTIDAIAAMAQAAAQAGSKVVIGTVPPSELWLGSTFLTQAQTMPAIKSFNAQLRDLASAYGYSVADYFPAMVNPDGSSNESLFLDDRIHPNATGYAVMWSVLRPVLVDLQGH